MTHPAAAQKARLTISAILIALIAFIAPSIVAAAPYAALVMDARSGKVLHSENADARLHPASLTKMLTLYIAFEAIENGEISPDDTVVISRNAASEPPSKLGLKSGQKIKLRYLLRAAAVKSANDAATAIGEAIEGSEAAFALRMNRTAKALGMSRSNFKNAHGLTSSGHLSTARDMTIMGRHLFYDYPGYYNMFSRITADAGVSKVYHTNRRLLGSYRGADGIKTGYTRAAGFNLTASAEKGGKRIIATVFGGRSTATRNAKVAELLDLGFKKTPTRTALNRPSKPRYIGPGGGAIMVASNEGHGVAGQTRRRTADAAIKTSLRPRLRPLPPGAVDLALEKDSQSTLLQAQADVTPDEGVFEINIAEIESASEHAVAISLRPPSRPLSESPQIFVMRDDIEKALRAAQGSEGIARPEPRPSTLTLASLEQRPEDDPIQEIVSRLSSGNREWGINVGKYPNEFAARKALLQTALSEMDTLEGSLRKVVRKPNGFDANFMGLSQEIADRACRRLHSRKYSCQTISPI